MLGDVTFASRDEVIRFIELELQLSTRPRWEHHRAPDWGGLPAWDIAPTGEAPSFSNRYVFIADRDGEFFVVIHSNETRGPLGPAHCLQHATWIQRGVLGAYTSNGKVTLHGLVRHLLETTRPNCWDPT